MKILNFKFIKNFGVFQDFDWDSNLTYTNKSAQSMIYDFKKINILYGRNYSGKTSLSKIIRSFQTQNLPTNYEGCAFQIAVVDGANTITVTQKDLSQFAHTILVYNSDFVKEHLGYIADESQDIESFTVTLGEENLEVLNSIGAIREELGSKALGVETGIYKNRTDIERELSTLRLKWSKQDEKLKDELSKKASSIKKNTSLFNVTNYFRNILEADIEKIFRQNNYTSLTDAELRTYHQTIISEPKANPPIIESSVTSLSLLIESVRQLCQAEVGQADRIAELVTNTALNQWVQSGLPLHQNKNVCAFCHGELSNERLVALRKHFDDEMKILQGDIDTALERVELTKSRLNAVLNIDARDYYAWLLPELELGLKKLGIYVAQQNLTLDKLTEFLKSKRSGIFESVVIDGVYDFQLDIESCLRTLNDIRNLHCHETEQMTAKKKTAQDKLRMQEVYEFCHQIGYQQRKQDLVFIASTIASTEQKLIVLNQTIATKENTIMTLEKQLRNEARACQKINEILTHDFGHPHLSLEAIEKDEFGNKSIKFEIWRDGKKAYNLSEGEQSLISFCYFMVKAEEALANGLKPIIWIDDPICSLDSNHIFFIYSLIETKICVKGEQFNQLFISTHNLEFLKYLRRINGHDNDKQIRDKCPSRHKICYYLIERTGRNSLIKKMPKYLILYVTEFNYLFGQLHKCAYATQIDDSNYGDFFNFANNARKFLEIYTFYKFPTTSIDDAKAKAFWSEEIFKILINRVNNEYSHLSGGLERGFTIVEQSEMQRVAKKILETIQESDPQQFDALVESITEN